MENHSLGLYIHIPFCKSKCYYCDFNSYAGMEQVIPAYFNALKKEIIHYGEGLKPYSIKTVFIGGGTPSLVDARYICEVLNTCRQSFALEKSAEISIETNPGTLDYEKLAAYKAAGINRLSIGLQAWQNRLLNDLGRIHRVEEFVDNFRQARKAGFKNINIDTIFGLPGQTPNDWKETLQNIISLQPEHMSCYSLKFEEGTVWGEKLDKKEITPIGDEEDREMYYMTIERLKNAGFEHYEISNFAKPGYKCRHNLIYWSAEPYLGVGAGAHSYLEKQRFNNIAGIREYITRLDTGECYTENRQFIDREEEMSEFMILGLRLIDGIEIKEFESRFESDIFTVYQEQIGKLVRKQLLEADEAHIRLTQKGLDLANDVFVEFI